MSRAGATPGSLLLSFLVISVVASFAVWLINRGTGFLDRMFSRRRKPPEGPYKLPGFDDDEPPPPAGRY